jgi:uncharacterized membrane protein
MTWLERYRVRHYLRHSLWVWPLVSMAAAVAAAHGCNWIDEKMGWESTVASGTAQAVLTTMAASMFTFIVFVSSALLVAVQLASSQLTPRIIAFVFRNPITKGSLIVFVFTFTFALAVLLRVGNTVPWLTTSVAGYSCLASLGVFLFLIDHVGKALRPSGALWAVAWKGRKVIASVYPRLIAGSQQLTLHGSDMHASGVLEGQPTHTVPNPRDGVLLAFDIPGLVSLAQRADCVIELVPQVGDFVAVGDPLFRVYGGGPTPPTEVLCQSIAVGQERTLEQDPAFAFRIMVDIASKGLSPAINDPTTAVLALDQIHHLLREVGRRHLDDERVRDKAGRVRLAYRTPSWEDFVALAVTEIRHFGGTSIQIARRMRAMLENLIQTLPDERRPLLRQELELLHRSAERFFAEPEDRALADVSDSQGVGGSGSRGLKGKEAKLP